jgi:hypothetical protein
MVAVVPKLEIPRSSLLDSISRSRFSKFADSSNGRRYDNSALISIIMFKV